MKPKTLARYLLAALMIFVGAMHFVSPEPFARIVPDYLPAPFALVYISGFFEILGGAGLLHPATRRIAAWGLIALYLAVLPANIHMAIYNLPLGETVVSPFWLWARIPLQLLPIAWAYWHTKPD